MNRPPEDYILIPADALRDLAENCLKSAGMRQDHAEQLAQLLTNGDLRGVRSHGTRQLAGYCPALRDGQINPAPDLKVLKESDTSVLVDGDGGLGYAPMMMATERAIDKAREKGVAVAATVHIGHYGSAGHYVRRAMEEGCTAFSVQGGPSFFGEPHPDPDQRPQSAYWGNPPLCFGLPSQDEPPLIPDVATCIMADYQRGGEFDALQEVIPAAFFKSMGYTGVARALGGSFVGCDSDRAAAVAEKWPRARGGGLITIMSLDLFTEAAEVRRGIDNLVRGVRQTMAPVRGYDEATLPGTIEYRKERQYAIDGVPLDLEDAERLRGTAAEFGVEVPAALQV